MPHLIKNIDRHIRDILSQMDALEETSVAEFLARVNRLRELVILTIVQEGEIDAYTVSIIKQRIDAIMQQYKSNFEELLSENQRRQFIKGIQIVDGAVEKADLIKAVPYLSEETLAQAKQFSATLIKNLTDYARGRIASELDLAVLGQKPASDVVQAIGKNLNDDASVFGTVRRRAEIIVRTEVNRIQQLASDERLTQVAKQIPDLKKEWMHSHVGIPRPGHLALDGTIIDANDLFTLVGAKGEVYNISGPYDPQLPPGESIACKCKAIPVVGRFMKPKAA